MAKKEKSPKESAIVFAKFYSLDYLKKTEASDMAFDYARAAGYLLSKSPDLSSVEIILKSGDDVLASYKVKSKF